MAADIRVSLSIFRALMGFIALFHLAVGGALMTSVEAQRFFSELYGAEVQWSDQTIYLIRVLGSFAFALGVLALLATINPLKHSVVGWGFVVLFLLRDLQRHLYFSELERGFLLSQTMNVLTTLFFLAQALLLAFLLIRLGRSEAKAADRDRETL